MKGAPWHRKASGGKSYLLCGTIEGEANLSRQPVRLDFIHPNSINPSHVRARQVSKQQIFKLDKLSIRQGRTATLQTYFQLSSIHSPHINYKILKAVSA